MREKWAPLGAVEFIVQLGRAVQIRGPLWVSGFVFDIRFFLEILDTRLPQAVARHP